MKFRSKDWLLLPLISLATIVTLFLAGELVSRIFWYQRLSTACGLPGVDEPKPNCTQTQKWFETGQIEEKHNDCGFRTAESCGPKSPGQVRGVVLGTSIASSYMVSYADSFTARTTGYFGRTCGRLVDFQNVMIASDNIVSGVAKTLESIDRLHPDFIVVVVSLFDFTHRMNPQQASVSPKNDDPSTPQGIVSWVDTYIKYRSHLFGLLRAIAYRDTGFYMKSHFANEDDYGFMDHPQAPDWQARFAELRRLVELSASKGKALNVPVFLMYVPTEPELRLTENQTFVTHPEALEKEIARLAREYHVVQVPLTAVLRSHIATPNLYYRFDGHPAANAHAIMASELREKIVANVSALSSCNVNAIGAAASSK